MTDQNNAPTDPQPTGDDAPQQTIPYSRFKSVNDKYRAALAELETLKAQQAPTPTGDNPPAANPPANPTVPNPVPSADTPDYKTKYEAAQAELDSLKLSRLRDRACVAHGIPLDLSDKLAGTNEATITADAIRLRGFLRTRSAAPPINGDTPGANGQTFSIDQLRDHHFYAANRDAIDRAFREGRIFD